MMKRSALLLTSGLFLGGLAAHAVSDRLDIKLTDGTTAYVMVDDAGVMRYLPGSEEGTFTQLRFTQTDGTVRLFDLKDITSIEYVPVDQTPFEINAVNAEHARWRMLYNFNDPSREECIDPTKPYGWRGSWAGGPVFWLLDVDKGWTATEKVVGQYTGTVYSDRPGFIYITLADDNKRYSINLDCQTITMPFEPVTMTLDTEELDTYAGQPWLGSFTGHCLVPHSGTLIDAGQEAHASLTVRANTTYTFAAHDIDVTDFYTPADDGRSWTYVPADPEEKKNEVDIDVRHGATVTYLGEGHDWALVSVLDVLDGRPDSRTNYLVGRGEYDFAVAASDGAGYRALAEVTKPDGTKLWWFLENYCQTVREAQLSFTSGTGIGTACEAKVMVDGDIALKFVNDGESHFIYRGSEAGTYTGAKGKLVLDGFGTAVYEGTEQPYTVNGYVITIGSVQIVVDPSTHTYTVTESSGEWTGSVSFACTEARGCYAGGAENDEATIEINFDYLLNGMPDEGNAAVTINVKRTDGLGNGTYNICTGNCPYVFDAAKRTITVTGIWVGTAAGGFEKANIELLVAEDMQSMYIISPSPRIYSMSRNGSYIVTGPGSTLQIRN